MEGFRIETLTFSEYYESKDEFQEHEPKNSRKTQKWPTNHQTKSHTWWNHLISHLFFFVLHLCSEKSIFLLIPSHLNLVFVDSETRENFEDTFSGISKRNREKWKEACYSPSKQINWLTCIDRPSNDMNHKALQILAQKNYFASFQISKWQSSFQFN